MIVGIDLGTTNSLIGVFEKGSTTLIPNVFGQNLTPSVVGISDEGEVLIGAAATDRLVTNPQLTASAFKRSMGTSQTFRLGSQKFRPEELSALVIKSLVRDAEIYLGRRVTEAVISVPAYFNDTQRNATRAAAEIAGLSVERLINEPTAAALAYGLHDDKKENTFLVFDVGGGTFDVSVIELFEGVVEVRASAGDNFLGGEDFLDVLEAIWHEKTNVGELSSTLKAQLRQAAEQAKRCLNRDQVVSFGIQRNDSFIQCSISPSEYESRIAPLLMRLRRPVELALRDARIAVESLDEVVLVGGATRMTSIQRLVAKMFGKLPLRHIEPDEVVARGAAVQAGLKMRSEELDDIVLTDVCPYTLGIESSRELAPGDYAHGIMSPIIERNTLIPASRLQTYSPIHDNQRVLSIGVYQGEARQVSNNIKLGEFEVQLPRGNDAEETLVDVRFTYDENGILEVVATVRNTGDEKRLVIARNSGQMSKREIEAALKSLEKLKIHPRDQDENIAMLNRANRIYEQRLGYEREQIGKLIDQFELILEGQDPHEIREFRLELQHCLNALEFRE